MSDTQQLYQQIQTWLDKQSKLKVTSGLDYPGIERDVTVVRSALAETDFGAIEFSLTTDDARPHFEWLAEISVDRGGSDYSRYLIQPGFELVRVQRKEITPLSQQEQSQLILMLTKYLI